MSDWGINNATTTQTSTQAESIWRKEHAADHDERNDGYGYAGSWRDGSRGNNRRNWKPVETRSVRYPDATTEPVDTERSSETRSVTQTVRVSIKGTHPGAGTDKDKIYAGRWAHLREHRNATDETTGELCAECKTEEIRMRPYQVRSKNAAGNPTSGWRTVYANSEKEAVLKDAARNEQPFAFPKFPKRKMRF